MVVPYMKGLSESFKNIQSKHGIKVYTQAGGLQFFWHGDYESKSQGNQYCRVNISEYKSCNWWAFPNNDVMDNMATSLKAGV